MVEIVPSMPDYEGWNRAIAESMRNKENPAGFMRERLMNLIQAHQSHLTEDTELGIQIIGGAAPPFHLRNIAASDPDILIFIGVDSEGNNVQLVQHHTQMSVLIVGMKRLEEKAYRIGFVDRISAT